MGPFRGQVYSRMCHPIENANTIAESDETVWGLPHVCLAAQPHTVPSPRVLGLRFSCLAWPLSFFGRLQSPSRNQILRALLRPISLWGQGPGSDQTGANLKLPCSVVISSYRRTEHNVRDGG